MEIKTTYDILAEYRKYKNKENRTDWRYKDIMNYCEFKDKKWVSLEDLKENINNIIKRKSNPTKHTEHHIRYKKLMSDIRKLIDFES